MKKRFRQEKTVNALLHLAHKQGSIDLRALMGLLYFADKEHFQKWGRTITGDTYKSENLEPLPSATYEMIQNSSELFALEGNTIIPKQEPNYRRLSKSDVDALDRVYERKDTKSCEDPVYLKFLTSGRTCMTAEDFADGNPYLLEHLKEQEENELWFERMKF
jgi:hypothetical protein